MDRQNLWLKIATVIKEIKSQHNVRLSVQQFFFFVRLSVDLIAHMPFLKREKY